MGHGTVTLWEDITEWTGPRPRPTEVVIISGDNQQAAPGATLAQPLVVEVRDQFGHPLPGAAVTLHGHSRRRQAQRAVRDRGGHHGCRWPRRADAYPRPRPWHQHRRDLSGQDRAGNFSCRGHGHPRYRHGGGLPDLASARRRLPPWKGCPGGRRPGRGLLAGWGTSRGGQRHRRVAVRGGHVPCPVALLPMASPVYSVAISPDGATLASGLGNGQVELWEVETGTSMGTLEHGYWWITSVAFSPDGNTLASGSEDQTIEVWDVETRVASRHLGGGEKGERIRLHPGGFFARWDDARIPGSMMGRSGCGTCRHKRRLPLSKGIRMGSKRWRSPQMGKWFASGSFDKTVRLWDVASRRQIGILPGHKWWVEVVAFSPRWANPRLRVERPDGHTVGRGVPTPDRHFRGAYQRRLFLGVFSSMVKPWRPGRRTARWLLLRDVGSGSAAALTGHLPVFSMVYVARWVNPRFRGGRGDSAVGRGDPRTDRLPQRRVYRWCRLSGRVFARWNAARIRWILEGGELGDRPCGTLGGENRSGLFRQGSSIPWRSRQMGEPSPPVPTTRRPGCGTCASRQQIAALEVREADDGVFSVAFSPDGTTLATGGRGDR